MDYEEEKSKAKHTLNNMGPSIALSVDILTDYKYTGHRYDFVCLAAHFIDDFWELRKWILYFNRKSDFIDAVVLKSMNEWNLEDKVSSLTLRNVDICEEVVDSIKDKIKEKKRLPLDSRLFHVKCCAEMFGSMAQDAFEEISIIICKLQELQWSKSECMWDITNFKLKTAFDMESQGEFNSEDVRKKYDVPSADEWEKVRIVYRLVESAESVAKLVFETEYPTANNLLYNLQNLRENLIREHTSSVSFASNVAKKMLHRLEAYIKDMFLVLAITSVMDPRCKMQYIENISTKFEDGDGTFQSGAVLDAILSLYTDYVNHGRDGGNMIREMSDLDSYLEEPVLPWDENFNVLLWWRSEAHKYPTVSKMARDILAIPMSVAVSDAAYYYLENRPPDPYLITSGTMNAFAWSWLDNLF